jgi:hypothetical protein
MDGTGKLWVENKDHGLSSASLVFDDHIYIIYTLYIYTHYIHIHIYIYIYIGGQSPILRQTCVTQLA